MSVRSKVRLLLRHRRLVVGALVIIVIVGALFGYWVLGGSAGDSVGEVMYAVGRHVITPDETPILATVTDKTALKTAFLQKTENGDKILIYEKARIVIVYRPSVDRIVTIGPVSLSDLPTS